MVVLLLLCLCAFCLCCGGRRRGPIGPGAVGPGATEAGMGPAGAGAGYGAGPGSFGRFGRFGRFGGFGGGRTNAAAPGYGPEKTTGPAFPEPSYGGQQGYAPVSSLLVDANRTVY